MFAVSSTKRGIPEKPVVLDRMPLLVLYGNKKQRVYGIKFFMVLDFGAGKTHMSE